VKLSFGIGIAFVPFGLALSTEYVLAANTGTHLSELAATVLSPYTWAVPLGGLAQRMQEEAPTEAMPVSEVVSDEADTAAEVDADAASTDPNHKAFRRGAFARGTRQSNKSRAPTKAAPTAIARPLPSLYVSSDRVLRIANMGQRPNGKPVTADRKRPAGVQVFGASALGVGVRDGDVITRVSGVPVTSPNQIIALVIAARGARAKAISAQVFRGQRSYTLTVEQPYLNGTKDDLPKAFDDSSQPSAPVQ
jgi:hypothetical protein